MYPYDQGFHCHEVLSLFLISVSMHIFKHTHEHTYIRCSWLKHPLNHGHRGTVLCCYSNCVKLTLAVCFHCASHCFSPTHCLVDFHLQSVSENRGKLYSIFVKYSNWHFNCKKWIFSETRHPAFRLKLPSLCQKDAYNGKQGHTLARVVVSGYLFIPD